MTTSTQINKSNKLLSNTIQNLLDDDLVLVTNSIKKLEKNIINSMTKLPLKDDSITLARSLKGAQQLHKNIIKEVNLHYNTAIDSVVDGYSVVEKAINTRFSSLSIPISWTTTDRVMFDALKSQILYELQEVGSYMTQELVKGMYDMILTGSPFNDIVNLVKGSLTGLESVVGTPMSVYAKGKVHDTLLGYYSQIEQVKAKNANIDTFLYYGNLIASSRAFCIARAGRVFTRTQINSWNKFRWKGKKSGSTFINRGGYNCRHSFMAVRRSWVKKDKIKIQNWYDDLDRDMSPKLLTEVFREEKKLASFSPKPTKDKLRKFTKK